jgi:hypothetical protein
MNIPAGDCIQNEVKLWMYVYPSTRSTLLDQDENKCSRKINISVRNVYPQSSCRNAFSRNSEFYKSAKKLSPSNNWMCLVLQLLFHFIYLPFLQKVSCLIFWLRILLLASLLDLSEKRQRKIEGGARTRALSVLVTEGSTRCRLHGHCSRLLIISLYFNCKDYCHRAKTQLQ